MENERTVTVSANTWMRLRKEVGAHMIPQPPSLSGSTDKLLTLTGRSRFARQYRQIGRVYFARSPGSDVWVSFYDLP